jgi:hypothetical protein
MCLGDELGVLHEGSGRQGTSLYTFGNVDKCIGTCCGCVVSLGLQGGTSSILPVQRSAQVAPCCPGLYSSCSLSGDSAYSLELEFCLPFVRQSPRLR